MNVRPDDIANLCAVYAELGTRKIEEAELKKYLYKSQSIDNNCSPALILVEASTSCLIEKDGRFYRLTDKGRKLANSQKQISLKMSEAAKRFLLRQVYLNLNIFGADCVRFLLKFRADTVLGTFVLYRSEQESVEELRWLKVLGRLGFLETDEKLAKIRPEYLGFVNELFKKIRGINISTSLESENEKNKVGDIAEECAMDYERQRLLKLGQGDLCPLVQRISKIDTTAGYDIISFRGTGRQPEEEIHIEVKGTRKSRVEFIWSYNERQVASVEKKKYWIYVFTHVEVKEKISKGPTRINNPIKTLEKKNYRIEAINVHVVSE